MRKSYFNLWLALILSVLSFSSFSQGTDNEFLLSPTGDTIYIKPITLSDFTKNIESSYDKIQKISESLKPDDQLKNFDSVYTTTSKRIDYLHSLVYKKDFLSINELDYEIGIWSDHLNQLELWKNRINEKLKQIESNLFDLKVLNEQWKISIANAKERGVPSTVLTSVNELLSQSKNLTKQLSAKRTKLLDRQNKITELRVTVDKTISYLDDTKNEFKSDYLRIDAYPIWRIADTSGRMTYINKLISDSYKINSSQLNDFYRSNRQALIAHLFLFLIIWIGFYYLFLESKKVIADENFPEMGRTEYVLSMHFLSSLIITLFISIWVYPTIPFILFNFIQLLYLIIGLFFLTKYIDKKLKIVLFGLLILFFLNEIQVFLFGKSLIARLLLLVENAITAWLLYIIVSPKYFFANLLKSRGWDIFLKLIPLFFIFIALSFLGNIFGYVNLSLLLNKTVVYALLNLNLLLLVIIVLQKSFSILFRTKIFRKSNIIRENLDYIETKFYQTIRVIGVLLWIRSVLNTLGIYDDLYDWFSEAAKTSWQIGNSTIAVGGILNFIIVIVVTSLLVRFLKTLLKEELYPRITLPRGVPGAISMMVGYIIVAYGFFIALGAAGVDLGQFGLVAGALGVGIGFGLQGIVANFIAGIVLAFERPIQVGDTIQIGTMMGEVTQIGVRACTIRAYDGSEVIVPNSTLITNDVTNWTLSNRKRRWDINVGVAYGTDPNKVLAIISNVANEHPEVQKIPAPWALFDGFGDSSLNFRIRIWTSVDNAMTTKSEVTVRIYEALQKEGIEIPFPQRDIYIKSLPQDKASPEKESKSETTTTKKPDK